MFCLLGCSAGSGMMGFPERGNRVVGLFLYLGTVETFVLRVFGDEVLFVKPHFIWKVRVNLKGSFWRLDCSVHST